MAGYVKVVLVGNLGGDPEMRFLPDGTPVCNFSIAANKSWKDAAGVEHEKTTWVRVTAWRGLAEVCNQYLTKGRQVLVEADEIKASAYAKNDGTPAASLEVTASRVLFLGNGQGNGAATEAAPVADDTIPF